MNTPDASPFIPTEVWTPTAEMSELDVPIHRALAEMNAKDPRQLLDTLKHSVEHSESGVTYAMLKGENPAEYSTTDALVMLNPFAHAATPNMLVRAEFIREVAKAYDVRDEGGKLKPVVMLATPGLGGSKLRLTPEERKEVRAGELGPASRELLHAVSELEIGKVALLGFSQGADLALAGARSAFSANLDTQAVAVGDPAGNESRTKPELAGDFFKTGAKDFKDAVSATNLNVLTKALGSGTADMAHFALSAVFRPMNSALFEGLTHDVFEQRVQKILAEGIVDKLVVGYGTHSAITKPASIEPAMQRLYERNGQDSFISVRVNNGKHTWGDQLTTLAKLYMRAAA